MFVLIIDLNGRALVYMLVISAGIVLSIINCSKMYLSVSNIGTSFFSRGFVDKSKPKVNRAEDHKYIKGDIESRSPCPGLNALANQGYM